MTRTITVAGGVFAPGHLGELTRFLPWELVDAVLAETGTVQRRVRALPSRVGVYFVLALGLFPQLGYARVWDKLVAGLRGLPTVMPSEKALRDLRRRLGVAPLRALFDVLAGPLAQPGTPGVRYRRWRTVAFDGCKSLKAPDAPRIRSWLGKIRFRLGWAGYPTLMLMALVETGTRSLLGVRFGPAIGNGEGEVRYATMLLPLLKPDMLVLTDRAFDSNEFLTAVAATGAQILGRITALRRPPVLATLPDGSYLSMFGGLRVRIIDATITVTTADGERLGDHYRLVTTLLDHRHHPAETLVRLYHERWEIESAFYALRHTILNGHVLRSTDPVGLQQELWALLTVYQTLRMAMVTAVETRPGTDPDRASFTTALEHARDQITHAAGLLPDPTDPLGVIGTAILANIMPPRRARTSVRKLKAPGTRYPARPTGDTRPDTSTPVTTTRITVHRQHTTPPPALRPRRNKSTGQPTSRRQQVIDLLTTQPDRTWHYTEIHQHVSFPSIDACRAHLSDWVRYGLIHRISPGLFTAAPTTQTTPLTTSPPT